MKIAILGASGFIGSALARRLEAAGENVIRLCRPDFDLSSPDTFSRISADTDVVVHAAGLVGRSGDNDMLWRVNSISAYYLADYLNCYCKPNLVLYLSSGAVYGMSSDVLTSESPLRPSDVYGTSKVIAESLLSTHLQCPVVHLRLFFPFGPNQKPPRLVPGLIEKIARGEPVELNTQEGLPVINPIFINTLIEQIIAIMRTSSSSRRTRLNLGGIYAFSIRNIAEIIGSLLSKKPEFVIKHAQVQNILCEPYSRRSAEDFRRQLAVTVEHAGYI